MAFNFYSCMQEPIEDIHLGVDCTFEMICFTARKQKMLAKLSKGIQVKHTHPYTRMNAHV